MTDETISELGSDEPSQADATSTPEEILAEIESDDPDVGADGTGVGELP